MMLKICLLVMGLCARIVGIFDAGSTGTRLTMYHFANHTLRKSLLYHSDGGMHLMSAANVENTLRKLISSAKLTAGIPIGFYGTAGFRGLSTNQQQQYLNIIQGLLSKFNLKEIKIIKGTDESMLVLKAFEFLSPETSDFALIDMGGRSLQVVDKNKSTIHINSYSVGFMDSSCCYLQPGVPANINSLLCHMGPAPYKCIRDLFALRTIDQLKISPPSTRLVLLSAFFNIFGRYGNLNSLNGMQQIFNGKCKGQASLECKQMYLGIEILKNLGIKGGSNLNITQSLKGHNLTWALGKALEINQNYPIELSKESV
ncbi:hypothetical protein ENBRE01_2166 [Enteropsectra breve]|nr:hypothetical protein ENBRE01_2166 [Enteropsectra breve]